MRSGSDAEGGDPDSGGLAVSAGSPLVIAARAAPPCPGSPRVARVVVEESRDEAQTYLEQLGALVRRG